MSLEKGLFGNGAAKTPRLPARALPKAESKGEVLLGVKHVFGVIPTHVR